MTMLHKKNLIFGSLLSLLLFLVGCGQKGDLYLPGQGNANLVSHNMVPEK